MQFQPEGASSPGCPNVAASTCESRPRANLTCFSSMRYMIVGRLPADKGSRPAARCRDLNAGKPSTSFSVLPDGSAGPVLQGLCQVGNAYGVRPVEVGDGAGNFQHPVGKPALTGPGAVPRSAAGFWRRLPTGNAATLLPGPFPSCRERVVPEPVALHSAGLFHPLPGPVESSASLHSTSFSYSTGGTSTNTSTLSIRGPLIFFWYRATVEGLQVHSFTG